MIILNTCNECPLKDSPMEFKIKNLCHKWNQQFEIKYKLDDFGRTICEIKDKREWN